MAKNQVDLPTWILVGAVLFIAYTLSGTATPTTPQVIQDGDISLCSVVEPEASFTAVSFC